MKEFTLRADELYAGSKALFYRKIPDCEIDFVSGQSQIFLSLRAVAKEQTKVKRRKLTALILNHCEQEELERFKIWLTDYFSFEMQHEIFELVITNDGEFKPDKMLEKALNTYRKV